MDFRIIPPDGMLETSVALPLSKSMSNRALAIAAISGGTVTCGKLADCTDTLTMQHALTCDDERIDVGCAGTAMRFLTAIFAATPGAVKVLDGDERMRRRPIGPLVDALRQCGASISYLGDEGFPPLRIQGQRLDGGDVALPASVSSQFASALMMVSPLMANGLKLELTGDCVSLPYIEMTAEMMRRAGADVERFGPREYHVAPKPYDTARLEIEADWSAASYWYEIQAISSGFISLDKLEARSVQGDRACAEIFGSLGVVTEFDGEEGLTDLMASPDLSPRLQLNMASVPDLVPSVVVTCCMLRVPFRLTGIASLRIKESDRIAALQTELLKLGIRLETEGDDTLWWEGAVMPIGALPEFDTHADHRLAMALAPVSLYVPGIVIRQAEVVSKSYPDFWTHLEAAGFRMVDPAVPLEELQEELPQE